MSATTPAIPRIERVEVRGARFYRVEGYEQLFPSVTNILSRAGQIPQLGDAEDMHRGSEVHRITAAIDGGKEHEYVPVELLGYVRAWRKWTAESGFYCWLLEEPVCDLKHRIAGTADRIGTMPCFAQTTVVVDLKTSASGTVAPWVRYQLAAYAMMLRDTEGERLERIAVAVTPKGRYSVKVFPISDLVADWNQFLEWRRACQPQ